MLQVGNTSTKFEYVQLSIYLLWYIMCLGFVKTYDHCSLQALHVCKLIHFAAVHKGNKYARKETLHTIFSIITANLMYVDDDQCR